MLERKALARLRFWKDNATRQALLVSGARQVGKTHLIRHFARSSYKNVVEINLIDDQAAQRSLSQATSADDLLLRLSVAAHSPLIPHETVVFIDEVQECPEIITFIKFLVDRGDYDYILSGSLLGIELESIRSLPIGYLTEVRMFPLDFEEFCWANGLGDEHCDIARQCLTTKEPLPNFLHLRLTSLFHTYLLVGGMPDAIVAFQQTTGIDQVRIAQSGILTFYGADIGKYAPASRRLVVKNIFSLIPAELLDQNRRFRLSSIPDVQRYSQVADDFLWLTKANIALAVYNVRAPQHPLFLNESHSLFKLYLADVGLLTSQYPKQAALGILDGAPEMNMGGIYENAVAQELAAHGFTLRYFTNRKVGEIDFLIENTQGAITAIEVKSGTSYKSHAALTNLLTTKGYDIAQAYVLAESNIEQAGEITYLPTYLAAWLMN